MSAKEQRPYGQGQVFPLWDDPSFSKGVGDYKKLKGFVRFDIEAAGKDLTGAFPYLRPDTFEKSNRW